MSFWEKAGDFLWGAVETGLNWVSGGLYDYAKESLNDYINELTETPEQELQGRQRTVRSATEAKQVIYGRVRTGGQLVYVEDDAKDNIGLWMCFVLAGHECEEVEAVYADNLKIATSAGAGVNGLMNRITSTRFGNNIVPWAIHGNRATAFIPTATITSSDSSYNGSFNPPNWTSAHKLKYQTYVWLFLSFDDESFGESGLPTFTFDVRGKNDIYDPRTGQSGYTDNHGLCMLDVLRWDRMFNLPDSEIDMDAFEDAAYLADDLVASGPGTTERRYTVNGTFKMHSAPLEILQSVARAGAAFPVYSQGKWTVVPGSYKAPVMDLDESDLVGGLSFQLGPGKSQRHNTARGTYVDASQDFETVGFRELYISQYVADDLEELEKSFDFAWTNSGTMARRLAKIDIERNRYGISATLASKFKAVQLAPGDRVNVYNEKKGWSPKIFRVESLEVNFNAGVALELREDAPEIYDWEEGDALALDAPPALSIPSGIGISAPAALVFAEELYRTVTRAAIKVRVNISWTAPQTARAYDVQYQKINATSWIPAATYWQDTDIDLADMDDGDYLFRVRSISALGERSDWITTPYSVVGKAAPPPDVGAVLVDRGSLRWSYPDAPLDLAGYKIRFQNGDRKLWVDASPAHEGLVTETIFDIRRFSGTKTFLIKAVDTTGNESVNASVVVQGLNDPEVLNVLLTESQAGLTWPGTLTGGTINASNELEATQLGSFWGEPSSPFWPIDPTTAFYGDEYQALVYEFTTTVDAINAGSNLTVSVALSGADNTRIDYKPPGYTGEFLAFPGSVASETGIYTFRFTVPGQISGTAPTIEDISVSLDVDDIEESFSDVVVPIGGVRLPITKTYRAIKNVSLTRKADGGSAAQAVYLDKDETLGPLIETRDSSGNSVAGVVDATIKGY